MDSSLFLKNAADKCGFRRSRFEARNIPATIEDNVTVLSFFGDMRSMMVLSTLLLKRYREEAKSSRYFILCTWPGYEFLFPYVDEYWAIREDSMLKSLYRNASGMDNSSELVVRYERNLNHFFIDHVNKDVLEPFYKDGIQQGFFDRFQNIKKYMPSIPSVAILGNEFSRKLTKHQSHKIFIYPTVFVRRWQYGKIRPFDTSKEFWIDIIERLIDEGFLPVVYQNRYTHDVSEQFTDRCLYVIEDDLSHVLAAMRSVGLVLDLYSGISRLALIARCPFIAFDERNRYVAQKEFEIDDLCGEGVPREYIFAFPTILGSHDSKMWKINMFDTLMGKLNSFLPDLDRNDWPSTSEVDEIVPYEKVRETKKKRLGARFIKVPKV